MKALLIGGTGTISAAVTARLSSDPNWEVWLLNRGNRGANVPGNVHQIVCDIRDEVAAAEKLRELSERDSAPSSPSIFPQRLAPRPPMLSKRIS